LKQSSMQAAREQNPPPMPRTCTSARHICSNVCLFWQRLLSCSCINIHVPVCRIDRYNGGESPQLDQVWVFYEAPSEIIRGSAGEWRVLKSNPIV
jgi:hypothetical protein